MFGNSAECLPVTSFAFLVNFPLASFRIRALSLTEPAIIGERCQAVATQLEFVAQYSPPVPPRGHCGCRMEVLVSQRGFSTDQ